MKLNGISICSRYTSSPSRGGKSPGFCRAVVMAGLAGQITLGYAAEVKERVVVSDLVLEKGAQVAERLVVRTSHITIDGNGATLLGPGIIGDPGSLQNAGVGILIEDCANVTLKNIKAHGFATGLLIQRARAVNVLDGDFSDNYHNPKHGWGELPPRGGMILKQARQCVIRGCRANRVWDALHLVEADDNLIANNDLSICSNTCAKLWHACRNQFLENNLSYGIRIDRAAGEVHARDSTCVLIESGSDDNYWYRNDITHGGDGIFIRPLNRWVSRGNVFVENDTSYANNNCVESWSPGNTFIRNKANHGSYGFWLGGSDQTVLIGNEAAFNGRPDGYHNAPEPGFGHGGIVIVGGPSSHTLISGNYLHDNNGAGIALRGDGASQGQKWQTHHWVVQQNRIENNRLGIWGRWASALLFSSNTFSNNTAGNYLEDIQDKIDLPLNDGGLFLPQATLTGPEVAQVGQPVRFDASRSSDPLGRALNFRWWLDGQPFTGATLERTFTQPGFVRLSLTVDNGGLADLAWRDLLVVEPVQEELGTEGQAGRWGFEMEWNDHGRGRMHFSDEPAAVVGQRCLRFTPDPYPGAYATAIYPAGKDAQWDFTGKKRIRFWIKVQNPNLPGFQNAGPVVRLLGDGGQIEFKPVKDRNLLNDPPFSEARWLWMPVIIPLAGNDQWQRTANGQIDLSRCQAISLSLDSWGHDPFQVWIDGLTVD